MWFFLLFVACAPSPAPPPVRTIEVVRGDTLGKLAKVHGVTVAELKAWNGLSSDLIEVGQVLRLEGDAPAPAKTRSRVRRPAPVAPRAEAGTADGPSVPNLKMPTPKACLAGPGPDTPQGDDTITLTQGLTAEGTSAAMDRFLPKVGPCLVGLDPPPVDALQLEIHVGCDGRVRSVTPLGSSDWPAEHATCLRQALRYAAFPAHALPDGDSFVFPLRMQ